MRKSTRWVSLISAVVLLFAGAETAVQANDRVVGGMLMAAGLVLLGVWAALEVQHETAERRRHNKKADEE